MQQPLTTVVQSLKQVRVTDSSGRPFVGELRILYYDGFLQKAKQVVEVTKG